MVDLLTTSVMGPNATFRTDSFAELFNPTNTTPPFFQVFDPAFLTILGANATLRAIASNPAFAFAHEAPIYDPVRDAVFFASNDGGALGFSDIDHNNKVGMISLADVPTAGPANISVTEVRRRPLTADCPVLTARSSTCRTQCR
jgi:gluconolactonase